MLSRLGVSRVVCRRYIVDHVPHSQRTDASHQFVTAGALGLAFGPLLASLIELIDVVFTIEVYGQTLVRFEKVSAPGWYVDERCLQIDHI